MKKNHFYPIKILHLGLASFILSLCEAPNHWAVMQKKILHSLLAHAQNISLILKYENLIIYILTCFFKAYPQL